MFENPLSNRIGLAFLFRNMPEPRGAANRQLFFRSLCPKIAAALCLGSVSLVVCAQSLMASPATLLPDASQTVKAVLTQSKVVRAADGSEKLEDASKVKPGDVIEYKVTYTNGGAAAVNGVVAHLPVPEGLEYQPRSAKPGAAIFQAAAANGVFAAEPLVKTVNGVTSPVPYTDYRQLRWNLGQLPAHGSAAVIARVRVETVIPVIPTFVTSPPVAPAVPEK